MSKITNDDLTRSGRHSMLYSCTHMATVGVKGLTFCFGVNGFSALRRGVPMYRAAGPLLRHNNPFNCWTWPTYSVYLSSLRGKYTVRLLRRRKAYNCKARVHGAITLQLSPVIISLATNVFIVYVKPLSTEWDKW